MITIDEVADLSIRMNSMIAQAREELKAKDEEIAQLKAKLAEKEKS